MKYVKPTKVRQLAHQLGRRCPRSWLLWLDARVEAIISRECAALGSRKTLSAEESEIRRHFARVRR